MASTQERQNPWDAPDPATLPLSVRKGVRMERAALAAQPERAVSPSIVQALPLIPQRQPPARAAVLPSATIVPEEEPEIEFEEEPVQPLAQVRPQIDVPRAQVPQPQPPPPQAPVEATVEFDGQWTSEEGSVPTLSELDQEELLFDTRPRLWKLGLGLIALTSMAALFAVVLAAVAAGQMGTLHAPGPRAGTTPLPIAVAKVAPEAQSEEQVLPPIAPRANRTGRAKPAPAALPAPTAEPAPAKPEPAPVSALAPVSAPAPAAEPGSAAEPAPEPAPVPVIELPVEDVFDSVPVIEVQDIEEEIRELPPTATLHPRTPPAGQEDLEPSSGDPQ